MEQNNEKLALINEALADRGIKRIWLARKVQRSNGYISHVLNYKNTASTQLVDEMLTVLKLNEKAKTHEQHTKRLPRNTSQDWQC